MSRIDMMDELSALKDMLESIEKYNKISGNSHTHNWIDTRVRVLELCIAKPSKSKRRRMRRTKLNMYKHNYTGNVATRPSITSVV